MEKQQRFLLLCYQNIYKFNEQNQSMPKSQPKPKIIYRTLEDIVASNIITKQKLQERTKQNIIPNRCSSKEAQDMRKSTVHSTSKHSLKHKQKLLTSGTYHEYSFNKEEKAKKMIDQERNRNKVNNLYHQLEEYIAISQHKLLKYIQKETNQQNIDIKVKEIQSIEDCVKKFIFFMDLEKQNSIMEKKSTENSILKESLKQNLLLEELSILNQKNKVKSRFKQQDSQKNIKKQSVYENIISRRH